MIETIKKTDHQFYIFLAGIILFGIITVFGWIKLQYGFNFIDEGYHMTKSWRLTVGDHFFDDQYMAILRPYTIINSLIFRINPDITLLGFRQLQFILTLTTLFFLSIAIYGANREYWYFPFIFSVFAFTGFDPMGTISTLIILPIPIFFCRYRFPVLSPAFTIQHTFKKNTFRFFSIMYFYHLRPIAAAIIENRANYDYPTE